MIRHGSPVFALALCAALPASADDAPAATPYRPTVSNPADLSAPGYFELETGGQWLRNANRTRRASLPYLVKYAFTENFGVLVGGEAWVSSNESGERIHGLGDTTLLAKLRFVAGAIGAFGIEAGAKLATARTGLGSDKNDAIVNGIWSRDFGRHHVDANLNWTRLGLEAPGESRNQFGWALSWSHPLGESWNVAGELSGGTRRGTDDTTQFLVAASYSVSKRVVVDAGYAAGLNNVSPDGVVYAGLTVLLR